MKAEWKFVAQMSFDELLDASKACRQHIKNQTKEKYSAKVSLKTINKELSRRLDPAKYGASRYRPNDK